MADDSPHGTRQRYRSGCKCEACRKASSEDVLKRRRHDEESKRKRAEISRRWYAKNRERQQAVQRAYRDTPEGKAARANGHAKRKGAPFTDRAVEYFAVLIHDPCSYCGAPANRVDHIVPIAAGGDGDYMNLTAACRRCNARKHAKQLLPYLLFAR